MHELLLLSQNPIAASSTHLTLSVLAGLAAAQPTPYKALHLVFAPTHAPASAATATRSALPSANLANHKIAGAAGDLFYLQLVGRLHEKASGRRNHGSQEGEPAKPNDSKPSTGLVDLNAHPWTLEFRDFPDAGKGRPVTSRLMASVPFKEGDPVTFVQALGYEFHSAYIEQGHQLIHGAIQLLLTQILPVPTSAPPAHGHEAKHTPSLPSAVPDSATLKPLDPSGAYLLEASVRIADGSQPELVAQGSGELAALRTSLRGIVELEPGDRMSLDTRVKV